MRPTLFFRDALNVAFPDFRRDVLPNLEKVEFETEKRDQ